MKKIIILISILFSYFVNFSQGSIKIYTELKEETAQFMVWLNEEAQDAFPSDEVIIEDLLPGKYVLQVSFNSDTIADWVKTFKMNKNEKIVYEVIKMRDFGKSVRKVGRGFGKMSGKTEENDSDDLVQYYRLEKKK